MTSTTDDNAGLESRAPTLALAVEKGARGDGFKAASSRDAAGG
jgi:hypothetical protein